MSGQAGGRRADDHGADGNQRIGQLIASLDAADVSFAIDAPADVTGEWWVDVSFEGYSTTFAWREDRGFGIFTSEDDAYGARPDELYREPALAARRLRQLARRPRGDHAAMRLGEVRQLFGQPQTALAERLHKDQGFISRLEHQGDALMSTVRDYVEALGGEMRLVVRFDGVEAPVDLPGRAAPTHKHRSSVRPPSSRGPRPASAAHPCD